MLFMRKNHRIAERRRGAAGRRHRSPPPKPISSMRQLQPPYPAGLEQAVFGLAASGARSYILGARRWHLHTAVGYPATYQKSTYERPARAAPVTRGGAGGVRSEEYLLRAIAEELLGKSQPDAGHASGHDVGTSIGPRSTPLATRSAKPSLRRRPAYQRALAAKGLGAITTETAPSGEFYFAEDYHQQYLAKIRPLLRALAAPACRARIGSGVGADRFLFTLPWRGRDERSSLLVDATRRRAASSGRAAGWGTVSHSNGARVGDHPTPSRILRWRADPPPPGSSRGG